MKNHQLSGSLALSEPEFLQVGKLRRTHGVEGEIGMTVLTDFPKRLRRGKTVYVGDAYVPMKLEHVRTQNKALLLKFEGVDTNESAAPLTNQCVFVRTDQLPKLPEGEYYHYEILGMNVIDQAGAPLGMVTDILETGANDVYLITREDGSELLFPAVKAFIIKIDVANKLMQINPPEWRV